MAQEGSAPISSTLVLFVAGEPQSVPGVRQSGVGNAETLGRLFLPGPGILPKGVRPEHEKNPPIGEGPEPLPAGQLPWHLPPSQMACLDVVMDAAEQKGRRILVVDVNRPGEHQPLVERCVGPNDLLPVLLSPDGARLAGEESFTPSRVRRFIAAH